MSETQLDTASEVLGADQREATHVSWAQVRLTSPCRSRRIPKGPLPRSSALTPSWAPKKRMPAEGITLTEPVLPVAASHSPKR